MWNNIQVGDCIENDQEERFLVKEKREHMVVGIAESPEGWDEAFWERADLEVGLKSGKYRFLDQLRISITPETGLLHLSLANGDIELSQEDIETLQRFLTMNTTEIASKKEF